MLTSLGGLEPPTFRLTADRANRLRHRDGVIWGAALCWTRPSPPRASVFPKGTGGVNTHYKDPPSEGRICPFSLRFPLILSLLCKYSLQHIPPLDSRTAAEQHAVSPVLIYLWLLSPWGKTVHFNLFKEYPTCSFQATLECNFKIFYHSVQSPTTYCTEKCKNGTRR